MPFMGWLRRRRQEASDDRGGYKGGIETITPSELSGWLFHPQFPLHEVRLLWGGSLIATATINIDRPDVSAHLNCPGQHGFLLEIPDKLPPHDGNAVPQLLALTADGSFRCFVDLHTGTAAKTKHLIRSALAPELHGLRGHFDGISPDGRALQGWCYSSSLGTATVWLHAEGLPPRALRCISHRPGMASHGLPDTCGFSLPLQAWPEAAGKHVWASFDAAGDLWLPPTTSVVLPEFSSVSTTLMSVPYEPLPSTSPNEVEGEAIPIAGMPKELPDVYQAHWQALEEFRELIDRLENQVRQAEEFAYRENLPPPPSVEPRRRRSALFRLWR
jgi:hypothetical protein